MEIRDLLLSDTDDAETLPVDQDDLQTKLTKIERLQPSISANLLAHHETPSQKKFRLFMYFLFLALAALTTLASQLLPSFVKLGKNDKEKKNMDISAWVLTGASIVAFIIYWPFNKSPESKKLSSLKNDEKDQISDLSSTLEKVQAQCLTQFVEGDAALYSSTSTIMTNLLTKLNSKEEPSIQQMYEELKNLESATTTIRALDKLQTTRRGLLTTTLISTSDPEEDLPLAPRYT